MNINPQFQAVVPAVRIFYHGAVEDVTVAMSHQSIEPYTLTIQVEEGEEWFLDRQMLRDGQKGLVSTEAIRVFPYKDDPEMVGIVGRRRGEDLLLAIKVENLNYVLERIENYSPLEADHSEEIDEELKQMLG